MSVEHFVQRVLPVVARDRDYPLDHFEDAITEGALQPSGRGKRGTIDRGIDAIIITVSSEGRAKALARTATEEDIAALLADVDAPYVSVLLLASERNSKNKRITPEEVKKFGSAAADFLTGGAGAKGYLSINTNAAVAGWFLVYTRLRAAMQEIKQPWRPRIDLAFASTESADDDGVKAACSSAQSSVEKAFETAAEEDARARRVEDWRSGGTILTCKPDVRFMAYDGKRLDAVSKRFASPPAITLTDMRILALPDLPDPVSRDQDGRPKVRARAFIGWVPAERLIEQLSRSGRLDPVFFSSNPRGDLADADNPGGLSLREALQSGAREEVVYGHNGIVVVAEGASLTESGGVSSVELMCPRIVNGRQSCRQFFEQRTALDGVHVPIRIVVTHDELLRERISLASNTQAKMERADLLALNRHVRAIEEPLKTWEKEDHRLRFVRLRSSELPLVTDRVVTMPELVDAFAAAFRRMPHALHHEPTRTAATSEKRLLSGQVSHEAFRALAWLAVAVKRWEAVTKAEDGDNRPTHRHHMVAATWMLVARRTDALSPGELHGDLNHDFKTAVAVLAAETARLESADARDTPHKQQTIMDVAAAIVRAIEIDKGLAGFTDAVAARVAALLQAE